MGWWWPKGFLESAQVLWVLTFDFGSSDKGLTNYSSDNEPPFIICYEMKVRSRKNLTLHLET